LITWASRSLAPVAWVREFDALQRALNLFFEAQAVPMVLTVSVAAPLGEELFFRGYALPALVRSFGPLAAALVSGAMFSALHLNWIGFAGLLEIGILLAALRLWSGSVWPSVVCHAANNAVAGTAFLLHLEDPEIPPPAWFLALGAVLLLAGIAYAPRIFQKAAPEEAAGDPRPSARFCLACIIALGAIWGWGVLLGIGQQVRGLLPPVPMAVWLGLSGAALVTAAVTWWREAA
jgi:hypothetical protein